MELCARLLPPPRGMLFAELIVTKLEKLQAPRCSIQSLADPPVGIFTIHGLLDGLFEGATHRGDGMDGPRERGRYSLVAPAAAVMAGARASRRRSSSGTTDMIIIAVSAGGSLRSRGRGVIGDGVGLGRELWGHFGHSQLSLGLADRRALVRPDGAARRDGALSARATRHVSLWGPSR